MESRENEVLGYYRDRARLLWGPGRTEVILGSGHADRPLSLSSVRVAKDALVVPLLDRKFFPGEGSWLGLRAYRHGKSGARLAVPLWVPVLWDRDDFDHGVLHLDRDRLPWLHRAAFRPLRVETSSTLPGRPLLLGDWDAACALLAPLWDSWSFGEGEDLWRQLLALDAEEGGSAWALPEGSSWIRESDQWVFRIRDRSELVGKAFLSVSGSISSGRVGGSLLGLGKVRASAEVLMDTEGHRLTSWSGYPWTPEQDRWLRGAVDLSLSERSGEGESGQVVSLSGVTGSGKTALLVAAVLERWARSLSSDLPQEPVLWVVRDPAEAMVRLLRLFEESGYTQDLRWLPHWDVLSAPHLGVFLTNRMPRVAEVMSSGLDPAAALFPEWLAEEDGVLPEPSLVPRQDRVELPPMGEVGGMRRSTKVLPRDLGTGVLDLEALRWDRDWEELQRLRDQTRVPADVRVELWDWMRDTWTQRDNEKILLQTGRLFLRAVRRYLPGVLDGDPLPVASLSDVSSALHALLNVVEDDILRVERLRGAGEAWRASGGLEGMLELTELERERRRLAGVRAAVASLGDVLWLVSEVREAGDLRQAVSMPTRETVGSVVSWMRGEDVSVHGLGSLLSALESWSADTRETRSLAAFLWETIPQGDRLGVYLGLRELEHSLRLASESVEDRHREVKASLPSSWSGVDGPSLHGASGDDGSVDSVGLRASDRLQAWVSVFSAAGFAIPELEAVGRLSYESPLWWADDGMRERWLDGGFRSIALRLSVWLGECRFVEASLSGQVDRGALASLLPILMVSADEAGEWFGTWSAGPALVVWDDAERVTVDQALPVLSPARVAWISGSPTRDGYGVLGDSGIPDAVDRLLRKRHGLDREVSTATESLLGLARRVAVPGLPELQRNYRGGEVLQSLVRRLTPSGVEGPFSGQASPVRADWELGGTTLPPVFHEAILGADLGLSGQNTNEVEADVLGRWLRERQDDLQQADEVGDDLQKMVLVLTPYAEQVPVLRRALVVHGVESVWVGTEAPSGSAGYPLVLVSTVKQSKDVEGAWGLGDLGRMNVFWLDAVGLAIRSLGIFGDPRVLRSWVGSEGALVGALNRVHGWRRGVLETNGSDRSLVGQVFHF